MLSHAIPRNFLRSRSKRGGISESSPLAVRSESASEKKLQSKTRGEVRERAKNMAFLAFGLGNVAIGVAVAATLKIGDNASSAIIAGGAVASAIAAAFIA